MSETPNRLKPKTTFPLSLPVNSSATTHNSSSNSIISTPPPQPLPYTSSLDKFSPPPSPREVDTNFSKKNSMASEGDLRKKSLPEIRSPPHPSALLRERDNGNTPSTPQNNIGPLHPNGGGGSGTTPLTGRGHRRGLGSRGSFDQSSASAPTSFDSTETSFILDDVAMPIGTGISLSAKQVRHLFPYHIAVNYDFQISQMGNALANFLKQRTLIRIPTTDHIGKYFRIVSTSASSSGSTWDWYQLTAQSNAVNSVLASLSASTSSTSSSFIVSHSQHHQTHSHQTRELTIELELSKDFLLQETSAPFRLTGTLHRIMPKEDAEALCFTAFFLLSPKIQSAEDMKIWQISSASELPHHSFQAENIHLLEEKRHSQETIAQQQQTIQRLEAELHNLKQSQSAAAASSTSTESTAVGDVRQLIGNVTHDLKTPLGGFLNGVDLIKEYVEELGVAIDAMRQSNSPTLSPPQSRGEVVAVEEQERMRRKEEESIHLIAAMEEKIESIRGKIKDISDINSFMTMTINRCIDYAKVGQNLKLKPKLETVDLLDTLYLPLSCMNSLQTRIPITLDPVDDNICSTVITDKQWLQENLLCLLSNAVKYSHEGDITVRMFVHPPTGAAATQTKENPTAMKYITRLTERQRQQFSLPRTNRHSFHSGARTSTNSIASSPNQIPHRMRTKSLTNEDYQNARIDANSPRGSGGATGPRQHTQHPSLDLTSHLGRLRATDLSDSNSSSSPKILTSQSITALPSLGKPSSTTTVVMTNKGPLTLDIPQIVDYELSTNQFLVFEVEDRGTGIKEEVRDTLFSPFQQAQRLAGGTGLGLFSLAKRLEALYGYFGVDGRRDAQRGSLFWFAIPYRPDEEVSKHLPPTKAKYCELSKQLSNLSNKSSLRTPVAHYQPPSSRDLLNTPPKPSRLESIRTQRLIDVTSHVTASLTPRHQLNILLVDDSMPILKTVRHALIKKGYEVDSSHNGLDCLDKVQKRISSSPTPYDVILMDLNMPVLDGLEATKRLRQLEQDEALGKSGIRHVIIGVSANSDEDTILDALSAGVDDFICKPFTMDTFAATLRKLQLIS